jgi:hypothetical protein
LHLPLVPLLLLLLLLLQLLSDHVMLATSQIVSARCLPPLAFPLGSQLLSSQRRGVQ